LEIVETAGRYQKNLLHDIFDFLRAREQAAREPRDEASIFHVQISQPVARTRGRKRHRSGHMRVDALRWEWAGRQSRFI
jgi:hypothetical protein